MCFDHRHRRGTITEYNFETPTQLVIDFWNDVDVLMKEEGVENDN